MSPNRIGCSVHGAGVHNGGRLSLLTNTPVTTTDQLAKTAVKYTPFHHKMLSLFDGEQWVDFVTEELSVAVPSTTVTPFDVLAYINSAGAPAVETLDWTDDTTRATALVRNSLNGQWVKSGDETRKYLGTGRTTGSSGQCEDSEAKRFLWNCYNREPRKLYRNDSNDSWIYTGDDVWRQARADTDNQVEVVCGVLGRAWLHLRNTMHAVSEAGDWASIGIGEDKTTDTDADNLPIMSGTHRGEMTAFLNKQTPLGYHYYAMTEVVGTTAGGATATFWSNWAHDAGQYPYMKSGFNGWIMG